MRGFKAVTSLLLIVALAIATVIPASAQTAAAGNAAADAAWKKVEDAMTAVKRGPTTQPKSAEESREMLMKVMQAVETESTAFEAKYPKDPRHWDISLFAAMNASYRNAAGLPPKGNVKSVVEDIVKSPDALPETKGAANGVLVLQAFPQNGDPGEWVKLAEKHLQMYPKGEYNATIASRIESAKVMTDLKTKPLDLKFTAVDGRKVDLAKMRGKVVMVDFWATWCGPCVKEVPNVVAAYEKLHAKGFEIVGISLDRENDKAKLEAFTKENGMPWPQYYDGKFWDNEISTRFGIHSIPAMWLVNKKGMVASTNSRETLEKDVEKLLAE
jgi:thiol-disulfide isomerase/thioredoxin